MGFAFLLAFFCVVAFRHFIVEHINGRVTHGSMLD